MPGPVDVDRDMILVRFPPTDPAKLVTRATLEFREYGRHQLSLWGEIKVADQSDDDVVRSLVSAAQLGGMREPRKVLVCTTAGELLDLGFLFFKDGDDDEPEEHYSVALDNEWTIEDAERFNSAWTARRWPA